MPEWDIGPPFSSPLLESTVKVAIVVGIGAAVFFFTWGLKETFDNGIEFSWGLFLGSAWSMTVALLYYWYLQVLKKRRPPKAPP